MKPVPAQPASPPGVGGRARGDGDVGGNLSHRPVVADIRRFRIKHALRSIEDALLLLEGRLVEGVEIAALERVRDDLAVALRIVEAECAGESRGSKV